MTTAEILKLIDAGFTKSEIAALEKKPEEAEAEAKPEEIREEKEPEEEQKPTAEEMRYNELLRAMEKLTGAIQAGNILYSNNKDVPEKSASDILAEVLTPKKN